MTRRGPRNRFGAKSAIEFLLGAGLKGWTPAGPAGVPIANSNARQSTAVKAAVECMPAASEGGMIFDKSIARKRLWSCWEECTARGDVRIMANVTVATFAIGADAANRVRRQLDQSAACLTPGSNGLHKNSLDKMARAFTRQLSDSPGGFDALCHSVSGKHLRVIWQLRQDGAGILYVVKANQLQTINLLLSGQNPKGDVLTIEEVGRALSPLDAYYESLAIVRFGARPMLATFCSPIGGVDQTVDMLQLAFASAFFNRYEPHASSRHRNARNASSETFRARSMSHK